MSDRLTHTQRRRPKTVIVIDGDIWQTKKSFVRHIGRLAKEAALKMNTQVINVDGVDYVSVQENLRELDNQMPIVGRVRAEA